MVRERIKKADSRLKPVIARLFTPNDDNDENFSRARIGFSSTPDCGVLPETVATGAISPVRTQNLCNRSEAPKRQIILRRRPEVAPPHPSVNP